MTWEPATIAHVSLEQVRALAQEEGYEDWLEVSHGVRVYNLRYRTQDRGQVVEATAAVGIPDDLPAGQPAPVLVWLHGTSGFMDDCAPSADAREAIVAPVVLATQGYIAVAPDFVGMNGFGPPSPPGTIMPYLVAEPTALSSIDGLRATLTSLQHNSAELPVGDTERLAVLGGSQGGHAALFFERYLPHYAPHLRLTAVAAAVPAMDLLGLWQWGTSHVCSTTEALAFVLEAMRWWYGAPADLLGILSDEPPARLASNLHEAMASGCDPDDLLDGFTQVEDVYTAETIARSVAARWDELEPLSCYFGANSLPGTPVPRVRDVPVLATFAEDDNLVITSVQLGSVERLCADEAYRIETVRCANESHSRGAVASLAYVFRWLRERTAGEPWDAERICSVPDPVNCRALR